MTIEENILQMLEKEFMSKEDAKSVLSLLKTDATLSSMEGRWTESVGDAILPPGLQLHAEAVAEAWTDANKQSVWYRPFLTE